MDVENKILIKENLSLTNRIDALEKRLEKINKKFELAFQTIRGVGHLVPNLFKKFEDELLKMDEDEQG
ncbi:MAG: hypothetical protein CMP21_08895 [Rickettsiales bacterium]|nr:hypothetical protein [Rickettsiales bacterium]|tara:strand:- start:5048 stop:5251 length:204 start_codon:yes stop_codon:yes gene_type:complete